MNVIIHDEIERLLLEAAEKGATANEANPQHARQIRRMLPDRQVRVFSQCRYD
jgi:hypothetical protein